MRICEFEGCSNPVFSGGYCSWHQWKRTDKKKSYINYKSKTREEDEKKYRKLCQEVYREKKESISLTCFFCGKPINKSTGCDFHHIRGRDGTLYITKQYLEVSHRQCHTKFHSLSVAQLEKEEWYDDFLQRLAEIDEISYNKQIEKRNK